MSHMLYRGFSWAMNLHLWKGGPLAKGPKHPATPLRRRKGKTPAQGTGRWREPNEYQSAKRNRPSSSNHCGMIRCKFASSARAAETSDSAVSARCFSIVAA